MFDEHRALFGIEWATSKDYDANISCAIIDAYQGAYWMENNQMDT